MSNYDLALEQARSLFLKHDPQLAITRYSLVSTEQHIFIRFLGRNYRINRKNGLIEWSSDAFLSCIKADYFSSMCIYDVTCYSKDDCALTGNFTATQSLVKTLGGTKSTDFLAQEKQYFNKYSKHLDQACRVLGGTPLNKGDIAYEFAIFDFLPVQFRFWKTDDDFPAQIDFLWDSNVLKYLHFETLGYVSLCLVQRLKELITMDCL